MKSNIALASLLFFLCANTFSLEVTRSSYHVPVDTPSLMPFSNFNVKDVMMTDDALEFSLPEQICGGSNLCQIKMTKNSEMNLPLGKKSFSSPVVKADCIDNTSKLVCHLDYTDEYGLYLGTQLPTTEAFLRSTVSDPRELGALIDIAHQFSGDPIGVLTIDLESGDGEEDPYATPEK